MTTQILVDGANLAFRAAHVAQNTSLTNGMEFLFLQSLLSIKKQFPDAKVRLVWDSTCTWRGQLYPEYKGSDDRVGDPVAQVFKDEVYRKLETFRTVLSWIIPQYSSEGAEADDVIAWLTLMIPDHPIVILSGDQDFHQLVDERVTCIRVLNSQVDVFDFNKVTSEWNIKHPRDLRWVRAFTGCQSDHIKGCGVPKKFLAECCTGVAESEPNTLAQVTREQAIIVENAKSMMTPGWLKRFSEFIDSGKILVNYHIMTLYPPRLGDLVNCKYEPDFHRFLTWSQDAGMASIQAQLINHFGALEQLAPIEAAYIPNRLKHLVAY